MKIERKAGFCKKCGKPLPDGYKRKCCEACSGQNAENVKKVIKGAGVVASVIASAVIVVKKFFK